MLISMSRRHRCAALLLSWMALGLLLSAGTGHTSPAPEVSAAPPDMAASHCGGSAPPAGEPEQDGAPCQWALPLLCCQQVAAVDVSAADVTPPPMVWLLPLEPVLAAPDFTALSVPAGLPAPPFPALQRSVVLQV